MRKLLDWLRYWFSKPETKPKAIIPDLTVWALAFILLLAFGEYAFAQPAPHDVGPLVRARHALLISGRAPQPASEQSEEGRRESGCPAEDRVVVSGDEIPRNGRDMDSREKDDAVNGLIFFGIIGVGVLVVAYVIRDTK